MGILPSQVTTLIREITHNGKKYNMFYRSGTGPNNFKYSISLFQDAATGNFVNGSYKSTKKVNGYLSTWRQDLLVSNGYGTRTYPFNRIPANEAIEHSITPKITLNYFKDPVYDGAVERLFPNGIVVNKSRGYLVSGEKATRDIKCNPLYRREADEALEEIERASANRRATYGDWD